MQLSTLAAKLKVLFASSGTKNTIPDLHTSAPLPANAAFDTGFPAITMTPVSAGGIPPFGADVNGILFALSNTIQALQAGAIYEYDSAFSTAIGGYAQGALLLKGTGAGYWVSTADNNSSDPDTGGGNWVDLSTFLNALGKYIDPLPTGSANVMAASITLPTLNSAFAGAPVYVRAIGASTITNPTYDGATIFKGAGFALAIGDIAGAGHWLCLQYDSTIGGWILNNPATGINVANSSPSPLQHISASVASSALTCNYQGGILDFRSATLGSGTINTRTIAANALTVPSGATLGAANGQAVRLWFAEIDNGSSQELAVMNTQLGGGQIAAVNESILISTTALSGTSNSPGVWYSTTARTGVPFRLSGYIEYTQATAGTYASAPSVIEGMGPGTRKPGEQIQSVIKPDGAFNSGINFTPKDNTIPQQSETNVFLSQAITPTSVINTLKVEGKVNCSHSAVSQILAGIWQDAGANALKVSLYQAGAINVMTGCEVTYVGQAGTVAATTFKVGGAGILAGTTDFNGDQAFGGALYGGACDSYLEIEEIMA